MKLINRIRKNNDFGVAINNGHATRLPSYLIFKRETDLGYTRVGLSVSKKLGGAVIRNRIKRQVRAMCQDLIDFNKLSLDIVIIVKQPFLKKTFDDNKSQLSDYAKGL